jgi:hypothetical protein
MISKDLHDPFRDISGKFFYKGRDRRPLANHLLNEFMEDITGDFLRHGQSYLGSDLIIIKYSWFTILPHGRVREKSRLKVPTNKWRQSFPGLKAGLLYEDKHSRWLGMDNYQVRAPTKRNRTCADFEHFRFTVCPLVCPQ